LIINADDFGLSEAVSRGIIKAHREGILTSTSFMVNFPWASELAPMLKEAPELGVGIHLNLTAGNPVLPKEQVASLVTGEGQFSKAILHLRFRVDMAEAKREWAAQVERGIALLGRTPTHLDTHRYLQGFPGFAAVMVDLAREYGIPAVRHIYPDMVPPGTFSHANPVGLLLNRYLRKAAAIVAGSGLRHPDATLAGDFDLTGLLRQLDFVTDGVTELISHPGEVDDRLRSLSSMREHREVELAALTSPEAKAKIAALGIRQVSFSHLG
jgi:hypothetical protein